MKDEEIRSHVYRRFAETGEPPEIDPGAARRLGFLADERGRVLIANPFSGRETPFHAESGGRRWWANCVWDALGILALLELDGTALCEGIELEVQAGALRPTDAVCHFLVPAREWYDDLAYT